MNQLIYKYNQNKKRNNYLVYFLLFLMIGVVIFSAFFMSGKSFICGVKGGADGFDQHYTFFVYYGKYLREILTNIFIKHQFIIPMWDYAMGYGGDVITMLHYYVIGDPLTITSVFVPEQYTEYLYEFLIILRYYLCGISFIGYCHFQNRKSWSVIIGALMYAFCGFAIVAGVRHPYFLNPMIYLPLLLIGIEKIYRRESPVLFIIMIFISAISNFYFFYMLCLLIFIYAIFRFFVYYHDNYIKNIFNELKRFILYYLLGLGLAAIVLIPVIILFTNTSRSSADPYVPLTYSIYNYGSLILNMFNHDNNAGSWTYTGFSVIAFFCLLYLFISKKKNFQLIIGFILLTIFICTPFFGSVFNGFSYVTNRWIFAYAMLVSYIVVETLPQLIHVSRLQLIIMSIVYIGYVALNYIVYIYMGYQSLYDNALTFIISLILMGVVLILLILKSMQHLSQQFTIIAISLCSILSIVSNGFFKYSTLGSGYTNDFIDSNIAYSTLTDYYSNALEMIDDDTFYRYDKSGVNFYRNSSLISQTYTLSFYYSMMNGYISDYLLDLNNVNMLSFQCSGVNHREELMTLASTKYYIVDKDTDAIIPYGFEYLNKTDDYDVYYNTNYLPLGYTYDQYITSDQYDQLSVLEKQDVLLNSVLVESDIDLNNHYENDTIITSLYSLSE
ncbi:MAG: YfhO family protein, partial [Erysipelotrichaceae bacterium]|nr:YfhO family protein [Erysipelotrichaceae bacterium]